MPSTAEHIGEITDRGFTVVPGVLDAAEVAAYADDLSRIETDLATVPATNGFEGTHTLRVYNLLRHGLMWQRIPTSARVLGIVDGVLDPGCLVSSLSSIRIQPGETAQPIHSDDQLIPVTQPHPPLICNSMWALTEFTEANGATRLVPRSHVLDSPEFGADLETVAAEMQAGDVLVWDGSLWHGGGANTTDRDRIGIAMNYCAGWLRQQENQQLGLDPSLVATFEPRLAELVGYGVYAGLIGHIEKQSPVGRLPDGPAGGGPARTDMAWGRVVSTDDPSSPLTAVDTWGARFAACAVVRRGEVADQWGDITRPVRIASITKLFTAWATLLAIEEGAVTLDDPAGPPGSTVRHLLCHASGLDFDSSRIVAAPGTRRIYSNTGYEVVADHVGRSTGVAFPDYLDEGVLAPLGLSSTELRGSAAAHLWSDIQDLLQFVNEIRRPKLLAAETAAMFRAAQFPALAGVLPGWGRQDPCPWGFGPEIKGHKEPHWTGSTASPNTFGHFGGSGTFLWVDPDLDLACITLTDRDFGDWAVAAWPPFSDAVRAAYG